MKVKVPQKIKIAGHDWAVRYEKGITHLHHKYGMVDSDYLAILIEPNAPDSLKSHTLLHELTHVFSDQFVGANSFTEEVVSQFATGVWTTLEALGFEFDWSDIKEL